MSAAGSGNSGRTPPGRGEAGLILVAGATGMLGLEICRQLRERGERVAGLIRGDSPASRELEGLGVELREGDLKDPVSLRAVLQSVKSVVSTATATTRRRRGDSLKTVDRDGQLSLVRAAREAGAGRFVYVSASPGSPDCRWSGASGASKRRSAPAA